MYKDWSASTHDTELPLLMGAAAAGGFYILMFVWPTAFISCVLNNAFSISIKPELTQ